MHHRLLKIRIARRQNRRVAVSRFRRDERGIQLAELAIVLPIFVLLFAATAEFGRYFYEYTTLAKAARVGSRYLATACVKPTNDTTAKNLVVFGNADGTGSPVIPDLTTSNILLTKSGGSYDATRNVGVPATVTVSITGFQHQSLFNLGGLMKNDTFSLNIDVKPSITMRYLITTPCV